MKCFTRNPKEIALEQSTLQKKKEKKEETSCKLNIVVAVVEKLGVVAKDLVAVAAVVAEGHVAVVVAVNCWSRSGRKLVQGSFVPF